MLVFSYSLQILQPWSLLSSCVFPARILSGLALLSLAVTWGWPAARHVSLCKLQSLLRPVYVWSFLEEPENDWNDWNDSHWSLFPWGMNPRVWERTQSKELVNQHLVPSDVRGGESLDHQQHIAIKFYAPPTHLHTHVFNHLAAHETNKTDLRPCTSTTLIVSQHVR